MYTYPSFLSGYVQNVLGAGSVLVGMIVGSYGFVQMLLRIPLGICSDRVKKRRVFVQEGFLATILSGAGLSLVALAAARAAHRARAAWPPSFRPRAWPPGTVWKW